VRDGVDKVEEDEGEDVGGDEGILEGEGSVWEIEGGGVGEVGGVQVGGDEEGAEGEEGGGEELEGNGEYAEPQRERGD
jgi:hypothetical protein